MFETTARSSAPDAIAPDGSEVRVLCRTQRASMAEFTLPAGAVSQAVAHRRVEEIWCFISGHGRMWRKFGTAENVTNVGPGTSLTIPAGTQFQFRSDGEQPLIAIGVTLPPWPDDIEEAYSVTGPWEAGEV